MIRRGAVWLTAAAMALATDALAQAPSSASARTELPQSSSQLNHVNLDDADASHSDASRLDSERAPAAPIPAPAAPTSHANQQSDRGNPLWAIPVDDLAATRERPLFSVSRRPKPPAAAVQAYVPPPPPVTAPPAPDHPLITLVGTVLRETENVAIFLDPTGQTAIRLHVGDENNGWVVRSVGLRTTILERENQQVTLALPVPNTQPIGSGPTIAAAAPEAAIATTQAADARRRTRPRRAPPQPAAPNPAF